jgi:glycosyltransferase involved in cell wall biosynthesis
VIAVTQFLRRPRAGAYSIERVFDVVRAHLPPDVHVQTVTCRFSSRGLLRRLYDTVRARFFQGDVNHVTGDVHFLTLLLARERTLLTIHDCVTLTERRGLRRWVLWFFWFWLPVRRCGLVSVVSEATRRQVIEFTRCAPEKVRVVHDPLPNDFVPAPRPFRAACPRILHVGTKPNKNLGRHVEAVKDLPCTLVVIGHLSDSQRRILDRSGVQYENLAGLSRDALIQAYIESDLLLFASTYEGFGLPIVEAQAIGRPVVTATLWSMPEVAGGAACLVDPYDVSSIRAGVLRVITDEAYRTSLVSAGFANVERFRPRAIAEAYAALYRELSAGVRR